MKGELKNVAFWFHGVMFLRGVGCMGHGAWFASHFPYSLLPAPGYFMISFCVFMMYGVYFSL
jgi:hypothetical protein